jgi:CAAX prenyl protease-like protein
VASAFLRRRPDPAIARCVPFAVFIGMLALGAAVQGETAHALTIARSVIVALVLAWFWPAYTELRGSSAIWSTTHATVAVLVGIAVFLAWISIGQEWAVLSRSSGFVPLNADGTLDVARTAFRLAGLALVVPVMEELFWRSFLLRWITRQDFLSLEPRRAGPWAVVITTALFAVEHERWLAGAAAGTAYALLYMRTGNLWMPILAHAVTNAILGGWIVATGNWHFW